MDSSGERRVRVAVLGSVLVEGVHGNLVEPPGTMAKSLIVALTLARGPLSVRGIVDDLWADAIPRNEKAALQTLVSRCRAASADGLIGSVSGGYRLSIGVDESDLGRAIMLRDRSRAARADGDWSGAHDAARTALALWRGEPGVDLGATELAERLSDTAARLQDELLRIAAAMRFELGDADGALTDLEPLLAQNPLDDELNLLHLTALAASGRRNDAIRGFGEFRERLRDQLGTDPSPALIEVNARLLRESDAARATHIRVGLRTAPNELVGRDADISAIEELMRHARLTTILGAGGLGKTRLAQELAGRASERTSAVYVVELAGARSGEDVPLVLASTLGIRELTGARRGLSDPGARVDVRSRVLAALRERPTLLVLDNCEHLVDAAAEWAADILDGTTQVRLLATSRAPLMIPAESVYQLDSLTSASDDASDPGPAVRLFIERARAARPSVVLPLDVIARLCDRLDGLPLAIELAAARVRSMSVEEIERRIGNRFALLRGGDRTAPERHRTLLAVIDWSWNLLTESQRRTLRRLSRFVDGFGAEAAQRVAADDADDDIGDDLDALINQSLVTVAENELTGESRYRLLETVREFGDMALVDAGEDASVRDAMLQWASDFCVRMGQVDFGKEQVSTFRLVEVEQENLVAALRTAVELRNGDVVANVFACIAYHWSLRGAHSELYAFAESIVDALRDYEPDDEHLDATAASYALIAGTLLYGSPRGWARPLGRLRKLMRTRRPSDSRIAMMADLLLSISDMAKVTELLQRSQRSDDPGTASFGYLMDAQLRENAGDTSGSLAMSHLAYDASVASEDAWSQGMSAQALAQIYSQTAHSAEALDWAAKARPRLESLQASDDLRQLDWLVAVNRIAVGELDRARPMLEFLAGADEPGLGSDSTDLRAIGTAGLAELALAEGDEAAAVELYRLAATVFGPRNDGGAPWYFTIGTGAVAVAVRAGRADDPITLAELRALRTRLLVSRRIRRGLVDRPITGTGLLGLAIWLLAPGRAAATAEQVRSGWELLALAKGLSARQDFPAANWQRAADEATAAHGTDDLARAVSTVDAMSMADRTERAFEAVREVRLPPLTPSA